MTKMSRQKIRRIGLTLGFLLLAAAAAVAHRNPAHQYEVSIYKATPITFWISVGFAFIIAVIVAIKGDGVIQILSLILSGAVALTIVSLPITRGYYFFGKGDALTHLGWAREINAGTLEPAELLYPGIHTVAVIINGVTGISVRRSLMLVPVLFIILYIIFIPLCARAIDSKKQSLTFATLAACLLLPINAISLFAQPHPATQAILFLPLPLFVLIKYLTKERESRIPGARSPFGILLALLSISMLFIHPQQTANLLLIYGSIVCVQWLYSHVRSEHPIASHHQSLLGQTGFLALILLVWMLTHQRASGSASYLLRQLLFKSNTAASDITQRAGGLTQIGGSIETMFFKLFLISFVFCVIAVLTILAGASRRLSVPRTNQFSKYLLVGFIPLFGLFGAYLATSTGKFHFRQLGFIMSIVTIFGAIGLSHFVDDLKHRFPNPGSIQSVVAVVFILMFALSGLTLFHSPFIFKPSGQVTEGEMSGYATTFKHRGESSIIGLRGPGTRFADALYGVRENEPRAFLGDSLYGDTPATGKNFTSQYLQSYYNSGRYLPITVTDRQRELRVYNGIRFQGRGFRTLNSRPGVNRVQSGGGFQLYYIRDSP